MSSLTPSAIRVRYGNYRGEVSIRTIQPVSIRWGSTEWHPEEQWLLNAWCFEREMWREFALSDCDFVSANPTTPERTADGE